MSKIREIKAYWILDSRGNPTVEVMLKTDNVCVKAACPSGASTGSHEVLELRDGGKAFHGKGVEKAIKKIEEISKEIIGRDIKEWKEIDKELFGVQIANATTPLSIALVKAYAKERGVPAYKLFSEVPKNVYLMSNMINGGKHAGNNLNIQEFMVVLMQKNINERFRTLSEVYQDLKEKVRSKYGKNAVNVGDEGGFAPPLNNTEDALELLESVTNNYSEVGIALDCAASEFYADGTYNIDGKTLRKEELIDYYIELEKKYNIMSIEDPFYEEDFEAFSQLKKTFKGWVVGDDLLTTNTERIRIALEKDSCNALLVKVNQIGTVTKALEAVELAKKSGWKCIISHRSGETEDAFIAHLGLGVGDAVKFGAPARSERTSKYNELMRCYNEIGCY